MYRENYMAVTEAAWRCSALATFTHSCFNHTYATMRTALQSELCAAGPSSRQEAHRTFQPYSISSRQKGSTSLQMHRPTAVNTASKFLKQPRKLLSIRASADTQTSSVETARKGNSEEYEVYLDKPIGIRFGRGNDGGAYVTSVDGSRGNIDKRVEAGDKLIAVSASFGEDVWTAENYGQIMYAIKTRNGELYFKFKKLYGDMSSFDEKAMSETERKFKRERSGGNYGGGTKELQMQNFKARQEKEAKRKSLFNSGLDKFNSKDIQGALYDFEEVIAMEAKQPTSPRDYALVSSLFRVAHYNIACCYAAIDQLEAGLEALEISMQSGFDQFGKIRTDPNLDKLRKSPKFKPVLEKFDEPVIDTNLFKSIGSIFGKKK